MNERPDGPVIGAALVYGLAFVLIVVVLVLSWPVRAHQAPTGWAYSPFCCGGEDCGPIAMTEVEATAYGWRIKATGEVIAYSTTREAPDGMFHRCTVKAGDPTSKTRCLYAPPMGL